MQDMWAVGMLVESIWRQQRHLSSAYLAAFPVSQRSWAASIIIYQPYSLSDTKVIDYRSHF